MPKYLIVLFLLSFNLAHADIVCQKPTVAIEVEPTASGQEVYMKSASRSLDLGVMSTAFPVTGPHKFDSLDKLFDALSELKQNHTPLPKTLKLPISIVTDLGGPENTIKMRYVFTLGENDELDVTASALKGVTKVNQIPLKGCSWQEH